MQKTFIHNRKNQKLAVIVDQPENPMGLAFIMHGLGGFKEQPHIAKIAEAFKENNYTVVRFDATNTFGESDGNYEDATLTQYYQDLEDVIAWATTQPWYLEPFVLAGHSFGGYCVAFYAENYPDKVKALAPISTVISGKLRAESFQKLGQLEAWEKSGWLERESSSRPGLIKKLKYSNFEDSLKHDLLPKVSNIKIPVLMTVGELDEGTTSEHQKILYDALACPKEFHVIKGAPHTFKDPEHLKKLKEIFDQWLKKI